MRVGVSVIASLSAGALAGCGLAYAIDTGGPVSGGHSNKLPITVVSPPKSGARPARPRPVKRVVGAPMRLPVYPITPAATPATAIAVDKVPSSINFVEPRDIERTGSPSLSDALRQSVPGVSINEVAGNPFQPNIEFRGFVGSPVAGTPQGLAVYQNGVRINEALGDTVNWDLIPTAAIRSVAVVTNNPAFGLNALGGAVAVQMKDGFGYQGVEINTLGGSFGRIQGSAQWGKGIDRFAVYGAIEGVHDDGFRNFSPSDIRRFYGDVGYRNADAEVHFNMGVADNKFGAAATVPIELLQHDWAATYTTPQTTANQVAYANLTAKVDVTPTWTIQGIAHLRSFRQQTADGNPTGAQPCATDATLLCFGGDNTPANGIDGDQLPNLFAPNAILGEIDRTTTGSTTGGFSLEATNTGEVFGHGNRFVVGTSLGSSVSHFNGSPELGTMGPDYVVSGSGTLLGQSGSPVSIAPVSLRTTNQYIGVYALDTFDVTKAFSITAGGRFNDTRIALQDQIGAALNGHETFDRFNPIIGGTYKITPELTAYTGYSEANRAPTPLELGCADPTRPCIIATFLVSDPPLKQVVSRTIEAGFRGNKELNFGAIDWKLGGFRATNSDDILAIPSSALRGFGFFQNVGRTRRQGIEAEAKLTVSALQLHASYAFIDARFLNALRLASNSPFADHSGNIQAVPGNQIPAIPRHRVKVGIDYLLSDAAKLGADVLYVSSQYFVGDESNQAGKLPAYTVISLHGSYQINKTFKMYGRIDNLFDNRYATYGTFFDIAKLPDVANGGAAFTDARALSPARPRAFYAGLKATF